MNVFCDYGVVLLVNSNNRFLREFQNYMKKFNCVRVRASQTWNPWPGRKVRGKVIGETLLGGL